MQSQQVTSKPGFDALFDLSFNRFITVGLVKFIYVLAVIGLAIGWLILVVAAFSQGFWPGIGAVIFGTVMVFLYLLMVRVGLELVVVVFRIGENTSQLAAETQPIGGFPVQQPAAVVMEPAPGL